jgi:hypothetical protein
LPEQQSALFVHITPLAKHAAILTGADRRLANGGVA